MTNISERANLLKDAENYFNFSKELFKNTKKDNESSSFFGFIKAFLLILFPSYSIALSYPKCFISLQNSTYYDLIKKYLIDDAFTGFSTIVLFYISIVILLNIIEYLFKINRKLLDYTLYDFFYVYDGYDKLKLYLTSRHIDYIKSATDSINLYNDNNLTTIDLIKYDPGLRSFGNPEHQMNQIQKEYSWFKVTDDTKIIATGLSKFENLVKSSFKSKKNLNIILSIMELLVIYEYSKILIRSDMQDKDQVEAVGLSCILEFGKKVNSEYQANNIEQIKIQSPKIIKEITVLLEKFHKGIESTNLIVRLFWWWLFLQATITPFTLLVCAMLNVSYDGDIVGIISGGPITVAAGLALFINAKK